MSGQLWSTAVLLSIVAALTFEGAVLPRLRLWKAERLAKSGSTSSEATDEGPDDPDSASPRPPQGQNVPAKRGVE